MKNILEKIHVPNWLAFFLLVILILRIPSFFMPYSYGDEMIYLTLGEGVRQGLTLYKEIYDNKPPLLYLTAAAAGSLFWFKAILAFWNLATIVIFWHLSKALFPAKERLQKIATIIFGLLTTIPLLEGHIVNAELFMIGPIILAFLILLSRPLNFKNIFTAGVLFSLATLFKVPAAFDIPAIVVYWIIQSGFKKEKIAQVFKNTLTLAFGFMVPIGLTLIWAYLGGALPNYVSAAFLQNIGYLSSWRPGSKTDPFLIRNLPLLIRAAIVVFATLILYLKRTKLSKEFIFLCLWLAFGLFGVTLSERPYPHYLIQAVPSVSGLLAILFAAKSIEQSLVIIPLVVTFFVPVYYRYYYYPTASFYLDFFKFATGITSQKDYLALYGKEVSRNYEIANFLVKSSKKSDRVFITGDSSAIYALSRRLPPGKYVADYHIRDYSSKDIQAELLEREKPKFIILLPEAQDFPQIIGLLRKNYILVATFEDGEVWKVRL